MPSSPLTARLPKRSRAIFCLGLFALVSAPAIAQLPPRPVIDQLNKWFNEIGSTAESKKFLNSIGGDPWITTPDEGQARLLKDIKDWGEYTRAAKIEPQG